MTVRKTIADRLRQYANDLPDTPSVDELNDVLRLFGKWRSQALAASFLSYEGGPIVFQGPFKGMRYVEAASEGALTPRLLGTYESELHPYIEALAREGLDRVIDVGCAEGYYAVGLARLMPDTIVDAYDLNPVARQCCAELAARNGVTDRVRIATEFRPEDAEAYRGLRTLMFVDVEGAETDVLDPARGPAMADMHIIVEVHEPYRPGTGRALMERFGETHHITVVHEGPKAQALPDWLRSFSQLDKLLAVWEWRQFPTPWLVMRPKSAPRP